MESEKFNEILRKRREKTSEIKVTKSNENPSTENWAFNQNLRDTYERLSELGVPMSVADRFLIKHIASINVSKNPDKSLDSMTKDVIASGSMFTDNYGNHSEYKYSGPNPDYYDFIQTNNKN